MNPARTVLVVALLLLLAAGGAYYFLRPWFEHGVLPPPPASEVPAAKAAQGPRYPIGVEARPLPRLNDSDPALQEAIANLFGPQSLGKFFQIEDTVRHAVATIDNLPRKTFVARLSPVKPVGGLLATTGSGEALAIAPANAARYTPFVRMAESVDTGKLVATYVHFYPLFQQAYMELGFPNAYFNDRLVEVIDHLLDTPDVKGPVKLVVPHVLPEFADPELEERSAGQKILIRMGPENAARIKAKLRDIRRDVTAQVSKKE